MTEFTPLTATIGGALIGLSAVLLMATLGRIAGISGIAGGLATAPRSDQGWRIAFIAGLILIPFLAILLVPTLAVSQSTVSVPWFVVAGLLVGIGTTLGNGCTSGHGVCGNARLSMRSLVATLTFMATGVATTFLVRHVAGGLS